MLLERVREGRAYSLQSVPAEMTMVFSRGPKSFAIASTIHQCLLPAYNRDLVHLLALAMTTSKRPATVLICSTTAVVSDSLLEVSFTACSLPGC
jgi:hypothetical protein